MSFSRDKILKLLHEHREGLGHNELKERVFQKPLSKWIPKLKREGLIKIENVKVRGGTKKLHRLTLRGIAYVETNLLGENLFRKFLEFYEKRPPQKDILQEIVQDTLDKLYGKGAIIAYFMPKSEFLEYQEWLKENKHGKVVWKSIPFEKEK